MVGAGSSSRGYIKDLLGRPGVLRWYQDLERTSPSTANNYLWILAKFCRDNRIAPDELVNLDDSRLRDLVMDYVTSLSAKGKSGSYQETLVCAIKSWLSYNHRDVTLKVRIDRSAPRISEVEKVPRKDELRKVLMLADLKTRAAIALVAFGGVRLRVLGNHTGTDGLRLGDLPELRIGGSDVFFTNEPAMVVVRASLNKAKHQYFTFIGEEGMEYVLDYLRYRIQSGEELSPSSPLIPSRKGEFMRTNSISKMIRKAIRLAGFDWRPYIFRHYFDTYMLLAEGRKIVLRDYRVFWMGHKGDIEHQYTVNKHKLPEDLVMDMRLSFMQASALFLETRPRKEERKEDGPKQKVVTPEEVEGYLEKGWEYVTTLPDGRIIVKRS